MKKKLLFITLIFAMTLGLTAAVSAAETKNARPVFDEDINITTAKTKASFSSVKLQYTSHAYTGKALKPSVTVKAKVKGKTKTLKKGTDYTITYKNNTNAGTASVIVKGKGDYKGASVTKKFKITQVTISSVKLAYTSKAFTGKALKPSVTVKAKVDGKTKTLKKGTDYTVSYANNISVGKATVTVKGKGNFKGTKKETFNITWKDPAGTVDAVKGWGAYDELIGRINQETNLSRRTKLMHQAEDMLMATYGIIPLYYYNDTYLQKSYLANVIASVYGTKFFNYAVLDNGSDTISAWLGGDPGRLDPALNNSVDGGSYISAMFAGLYGYNELGQPVPDCAESCKVSEDGRTYTVTLRSGLKWSDGSDLTAYDFEYSWKRAVDPALKADYAYIFGIFDGYDTGSLNVTALSDTKLQFVLKEPCAYMEDLMAFPIFFPVKQSEVEADPQGWASHPGFVCNGAYVCREWTGGNAIVLQKNAYFYNAGQVSTNNLRFVFNVDENSAYDAYKNGKLDFIAGVLPSVIKSGDPELHIIDQLGTYYVQFNVTDSLFKGLSAGQANAVREAVSLLIDRYEIVQKNGNGVIGASTFIPVGMSDGNGGIFHSTNLDGYYDPYAFHNNYDATVSQARKLLQSAGYQFDSNGKLSSKTPLKIKYTINEGGGHEMIAEVIKNGLAVLGIKATVETLAWKDILNAWGSGKFTMSRGGWIADFNDPVNMLEIFASYSGNNTAQFGK